MNADHPFACGVMLKMLTAQTTDSQWQPMQIDASATVIHKVSVMTSDLLPLVTFITWLFNFANTDYTTEKK